MSISDESWKIHCSIPLAITDFPSFLFIVSHDGDYFENNKIYVLLGSVATGKNSELV